MAIALRFVLAASALWIALAPGSRGLAAETTQETVNRYNSADPTVPMKSLNAKPPSMMALSNAVADYLIRAQKEDADKKLDLALADARKAEAAAHSGYEKLKVSQTLTQIYSDMGDTANAARAAETAADLQGIPPQEQTDTITNACILATMVQDYDKAARYARMMQGLNLADERSKRIIETALQNDPRK